MEIEAEVESPTSANEEPAESYDEYSEAEGGTEVEGVEHGAFAQAKLDATIAELEGERAAVAELLRS